MISAKAYTIEKHLFVPTGNTFGDCSSPPSWEPFAKARMALATQLSRGLQFVTEDADYLGQVVFAPPPLPGTKFAQARPDRFNPGVPVPFDGTLPAAPFPMHVDDCLYVSAGQSWMRYMMRCGIVTLIRIWGPNEPHLRAEQPDREKFLQRTHESHSAPARIRYEYSHHAGFDSTR